MDRTEKPSTPLEREDQESSFQLQVAVDDVYQYLVRVVERHFAKNPPFRNTGNAQKTPQSPQNGDNNEETPTISNVHHSTNAEPTHSQGIAPRLINMHSSTSTTRQTSKSEKINTEEGYDQMFELGYNSDGQLPY